MWGRPFIKPLNLYGKPGLLNFPLCTHDIPHTHHGIPWCTHSPPPPGVLNSSRCTHDPSTLIMVSPRCTQGIPPNVMSSLWCTQGIPQCTHDIPRCTEHPQCAQWYPRCTEQPPVHYTQTRCRVTSLLSLHKSAWLIKFKRVYVVDFCHFKHQ